MLTMTRQLFDTAHVFRYMNNLFQGCICRQSGLVLLKLKHWNWNPIVFFTSNCMPFLMTVLFVWNYNNIRWSNLRAFKYSRAICSCSCNKNEICFLLSYDGVSSDWVLFISYQCFRYRNLVIQSNMLQLISNLIGENK